MASHYNSRRLPVEVLIESRGTYRQIRERDQFEDLWSHEIFDFSSYSAFSIRIGGVGIIQP